MDDETQAIGLLKEGNITGLELLVRKYQTQALRVAYLITQEQTQAEDIVQDAFIRVYERIDQFKPNHKFYPWFFRIVANDAIKLVRKQRRLVSLDQKLNGNTIGQSYQCHSQYDEIVNNKEMFFNLWSVINRLSVEKRVVIVLYYFMGYKESEIASILKTPLGTIKWRKYSAIRTIRKMLKENKTK